MLRFPTKWQVHITRTPNRDEWVVYRFRYLDGKGKYEFETSKGRVKTFIPPGEAMNHTSALMVVPGYEARTSRQLKSLPDRLLKEMKCYHEAQLKRVSKFLESRS